MPLWLPLRKRRVTMLTEKQRRVLHDTLSAPARWNISVGAVRSGKTYLDFFRIPARIIRADRAGGIAIIGNTASTVERNILSPMRQIHGERLVGRVGKGGAVRLFGREALVLGAYQKGCAARLQGMSLSYCYGDEITTWDKDVFEMVKSRLDRSTSVFDGSCNPASPFHWFKRFLDEEEGKGAKVTCFTIDDNEFLPPAFVNALKREYTGSVWYDRFILGKWTAADGSIYTKISAKPSDFVTSAVPEIIACDMGVDFGGNGSATAFALTGYTRGYAQVITLDEYYRKGNISPAELERDFADFVRRAREKYPLRDVYCDSAEQLLIRGLDNTVRRQGLGVQIHNARKYPVNERIRFYTALQGSGRYFLLPHCEHTLQAFCEAVWDGESRLDNGSTNIDSLDAQEYSTERRMKEILDTRPMSAPAEGA